ncbi:MAG: hypothetical protein ACKPKO_47425, partial [Candidatus Fonsibacter sp.]
MAINKYHFKLIGDRARVFMRYSEYEAHKAPRIGALYGVEQQSDNFTKLCISELRLLQDWENIRACTLQANICNTCLHQVFSIGVGETSFSMHGHQTEHWSNSS